MKYLKRDNTWSLTPDVRMDVRDELPPGNYTLCKNPLTGEYYLEESEPFVLPPKLYGKTVQWTDRILDAFNREENQTGVLLAGTKGSGKTLLSKNLAVASGLPVLLVNSPFSDDRFMRVIQGIPQRAVVIFDEFEKLYDKEAQERVLTLFDGVYTASKKLMVLTCNNRYSVQDFFHNRPGRIRYSIVFEGLDAAFIQEYCHDKLSDPAYVEDILKTAVGCGEFNFDMLQALVRELNMYGGTVEETVEILNVKPLSTRDREWVVTLVAPEHPKLKLSTKAVFSTNPVTYLSRGNGYTFDMNVGIEGEFNNGEKFSDHAYAEVRLSDIKNVDPYKGIYDFEFELEIAPEGVRGTGITVRMTAAEQSPESMYGNGWNFAF